MDERMRNKLFSKMVLGILDQKWVQSVDEFGKCRYRGKDGHKCAIGQLVSDDFVDRLVVDSFGNPTGKPVEGCSVVSLTYHFQHFQPEILQAFHMNELAHFQTAHDEFSVSKKSFAELRRQKYEIYRKLANKLGLKFPQKEADEIILKWEKEGL